MAWTLTTLKEAIKDYLVEADTEFVANLDNIIVLSEDRILKKVQLPDFRKNVTGSMTADTQYVGIPADFLAPYSLAIDNSGLEFLIYKDVNFIREVYPITTATGVPAYYSTWDDEFFIVGPTPDSNYPVELHYFYKPESITTAVSETSWLGTHAPTTLFDVCIHEAYVFLKGDPDLMAEYKERATQAIQDLKVLAEGRNVSDEYRRGR